MELFIVVKDYDITGEFWFDTKGKLLEFMFTKGSIYSNVIEEFSKVAKVDESILYNLVDLAYKEFENKNF